DLGVDAEDARALAGEEDGRRLAVAEAGPARARPGDDGHLAGEPIGHGGAAPRQPLNEPSMRASIRYGPPEASPRRSAGPASAVFSTSSPGTPSDRASPT